VTIDRQQGEPVEEQIERTRASWSRRESPDGSADLWKDIRSSRVSGNGRRGLRDQVGLPREFQVDRLQAPRGL
jgi:hypothetical protein